MPKLRVSPILEVIFPGGGVASKTLVRTKLLHNHVAISILYPHPRNSSIYGDEGVSELVELIRQSGWIKPLVVSSKHTIISGNRRWKAVRLLGWESTQVKYREFINATAELEALLLKNAIRFKTNEQKVWEAMVWKEVEATKATNRQIELAGNRPDTEPDKREKFRIGTEDRTVDRLASRVGLGSGRNYERAAKVVGAINLLLKNDPRTTIARRKVLNERSVDALLKRLKRVFCSNAQVVSLNDDSLTANVIHNAVADDALHSCWNCRPRGGSIKNHNLYRNCLGVFSLIDKSADERGAECNLWSNRETNSDEARNNSAQSTFNLILSAHLQPLIQDAARTTVMSVVDWATDVVLESKALETLQPIGENERQPRACRGP